MSPSLSSSRVELITANGVCMSWLTPARSALRTRLAASVARYSASSRLVRQRASSSPVVNGFTT